jgi:hypothetical protein
MANSARVTTGNLPRLLQLGIDKIIQHYMKSYKGVGMEIFTKVPAEKGFYEAVQLAGMGLASRKGEGAPITYDSVDQNWVYRWPIYAYEKSARVTMEAIADNLYEDLLPMMGKEQAKALAHNKDFQMAAVLNAAFSTTGPDGKVLCASDHPIQAGGTSTNLLSPALDLSEDAIEQMVILVDKFVNPDGLLSDYNTQNLVVPIDLRFEADRIVNSRYRPGSADNDISAIYNQAVIKKVVPWKRLTDTDAFFITTDAENSLCIAQKKEIETRSFVDNFTYDVIVTAFERFRTFFADWRGLVGSAGA